MWRDMKADYYKDSRDFSHLLESRAESEHEPSKNRQDFLRRRQKINEILKSKEKVRPDQGPSSSSRTGSSSREPQRELPYDKSFGSFFGPSQPIVARRVLEEDRNRDEKRRLAAKMAKQANQARPASSKQLQVSSSSKTIAKSTQKPVKSFIKTKLDKVQKLKEARDYSFLFSEGDNNAEAAPQSKPNKTASSTQKTSSKPSGASANPARAKPADTSRRPSNTNARPQSAPPQTKMVPKTSSKPSRPGTTTTTISANTSRAKLPDPSRRPTSNTNANDRRAFQQTKPATISSAQKAVMKPKPGAKPADAVRRIPNTTARPAPAAKQKPAQIQRKRPSEDFVSDDDDDDDGDNFNYRSLLPPQFRLDSRRRYDDDDGYSSSDMEANFSTIQAEEARSSRIAREEDERELKLLEEEERQARLRKKKRRM